VARSSRATKGEPFSIRLSKPTDQFVAEEARRTKRSKSAIVEALTEEAARMRRFPGIAFRGDEGSRDAWVIGTALDVWQIIEAYRDFGSIERMLAETDLSERQLRLALAYADAYPDEIEQALAENRRPIEELRELYPFLRIVEVPPED
jgi:uncharacterized protein (DUF433 family)